MKKESKRQWDKPRKNIERDWNRKTKKEREKESQTASKILKRLKKGRDRHRGET